MRTRAATRVAALLCATVTLGVLAWPLDAALAQGCAMCRTALEGVTDPLTEAFNTSTLFLIATPYTVVGAVAAWIVIGARRRDRRPEDSTEVPLE